MEIFLAQKKINIGDEFKLGAEGIGNKKGYHSIGEFISAILPNAYIIAGLILFFLILFGGFTMITAGGDSEKIGQGSKAITAALAGFVLVFASYWIIQIIQVLTGVKIFSPEF